MAPERSTEALVGAAQQGDREALGRLLSRHATPLRQFVRLRGGARFRRRESESDILQSVFRVALDRIDRFEYRGERSFRNWLFTCALNILRSRARAHGAAKRDAAREITGPWTKADADAHLADAYATLATPSRHAMQREQMEHFEDAFDRLAADHREVLLLISIEGLSSLEAGERLGKSPDAVRQLHARARLRLATLLERGSR